MTFKPAKWPRRLRSAEWYDGSTKDVIYHRGWMKNQGYPDDLFDGRPVIGILNTWSDMTPCNGHLRELAEKVKAGIWEAGGFPLEVPVFSASENTFRPTAMMFRNLAALSIEEQIRGQPMDGCVLMVGCDKTTPSLLMAAASCDLPSIVVTGGPMLNGWFQGERVGAGTHLWRFSEAVKAGEMAYTVLQPVAIFSEEAVRQAELVSYVVDRETYDIADNQTRIPDVLTRSQEQARASLVSLWTKGSENYPPDIYTTRSRLIVKVISIALLTETTAQVRFRKTLETESEKPVERDFVATVGFEFQPKTERNLEAVWNNPLGFVVTNYRVDAETLEN